MDSARLTAEAQQSLRSGCPGPLCVELWDYGQVSTHLHHYAQGNVTIWLGTEYTTYGLYSIIPQVRFTTKSCQWGWEQGMGWPCPTVVTCAGEAAGGQLLSGDARQGCEECQGAGTAASSPRKAVPIPSASCSGGDGDTSRYHGAAHRFGMRWLSSNTCCGWRRWCHKGWWMSFRVPATSMPSAGWCLPGGAAGMGQQGPPRHVPLPLPSRAQQHSHGPSFESISASGLNAALAHYRCGDGEGDALCGDASDGFSPLPFPQPSQRQQPAAVSG